MTRAPLPPKDGGHAHGALSGTWGMLMHGPGRLGHPFFGGTLWINVPITRIQPILLDSNGSGSRWIPVDSSMVGVQRNYQLWFRDPAPPRTGRAWGSPAPSRSPSARTESWAGPAGSR